MAAPWNMSIILFFHLSSLPLGKVNTSPSLCLKILYSVQQSDTVWLNIMVTQGYLLLSNLVCHRSKCLSHCVIINHHMYFTLHLSGETNNSHVFHPERHSYFIAVKAIIRTLGEEHYRPAANFNTPTRNRLP